MGPAFLTVVRDPAGELERKGGLREFQDPSRCRIAYSVRPGTDYSTEWVAQDLLRALGKHTDNTGEATGQGRFAQACAWMVGHQTRDILVASAGLLRRQTLPVLIE